MADLVQRCLGAWALDGDRSAGSEALDLLAREWRPRVRAFLDRPSPDEVEDCLADALEALCFARQGDRPRALAPEDADNPAAWRRRVLRNHLVDRSRRRARRRAAERGLGEGWSPSVEAREWRREQDERTGRAGPPDEPLVDPRPAPPTPQEVAEDHAELAVLRHEVIAVLPQLAIRRRVLLLLALGGDPSVFAVELAQELGEDAAEIGSRIEDALAAPHDGRHEYLSLHQIRVVWPTEAEAAARETARKNLARAMADVRKLVGDAS